MKTKKSQAAMEFLMTYGWAILAAIIAIGVLAYFGVFSPGNYVYEDFEIYKEKCENIIEREGIIRHFACNFPQGKPSNAQDFIWVEDSAEFGKDTFPLGRDGYDWNQNYGHSHWVCDKTECKIYSEYGCGLIGILEISNEREEEICERVLVNEIEIHERNNYNQSWYEACLFANEWNIKKENRDIIDCEQFITRISKQDLSTEWLEENCECVDCPCRITFANDCKWATEEDCLRNCKEYRCNNYIVKVKGGI